jgi:4-alpha-glucanotransferase
VSRTKELKIAFNRAKDRQRVIQEDLGVIKAWFKLVRETMEQYGVHLDDVHNFDETGFQMGVVGSMKVATSSERGTKPNQYKATGKA